MLILRNKDQSKSFKIKFVVKNVNSEGRSLNLNMDDGVLRNKSLIIGVKIRKRSEEESQSWLVSLTNPPLCTVMK